jgi:hypothetical protein
VPPGLYRVVLSVDGKDYTQTIRIEPDPNAPNIEIVADDSEDEGLEENSDDEEGEYEGRDGPIIR